MFDLMKRAGVLDAELSRLVGVSRTAVHDWRHKGTTPSKWIAPKLEKLVDAIGAAVDAGDLPLPKNLSQSDHKLALTRTVIYHVAALKGTKTS